MTIPKAVSPSTLTPGLFLKVNLVSGAASPGTGTLRCLLISPKAAGAALTPNTELLTGGGEESAAAAYGTGALGHLAAKQLYGVFPTAQVDFVAPTAGAGAAIGTITFGGAPTSNTAFEVEVAGRTKQLSWLSGEAATVARDRAVATLQAMTNDLPASATAGAGSTLTITSKVTGNCGNDIRIRARLLNTQTGTETLTPATLTNLAGGTTDPDISDVLALASGREYHYVLPCLSNADALSTAASSNVEVALDAIGDVAEGLNAKLQQLVVASTTTQSAAITAAIARNAGTCEHVLCVAGRSLPAEFAAAEVGGRLAAVVLDPAANRIGSALGSGLYGSDTPVSDTPTPAECEAAIGAGLTLVSYDASGDIYVVRPVTTYSRTATGEEDHRLLDTQNVDATYIVARDMRQALPIEFPGAKIQRDSLPGEDPPAQGVIEERDIRAFVISRLRFWQRAGVILKSELDRVIDNGELIVAVDDTDASQVNIVLPFTIVPPLAKFGVVVNRKSL